MQAGNVIRVRSVSSVDFTAAMLHGGGAQVANINAPQSIAAGKHCRSRVRELRIWSKTKIQWGVQFWATAAAAAIGGTVIDTEAYLGEWSFGNSGQPGDGSRATGDTFYYYYISGLDIAYQDGDTSGQIHLRLINWDAAVDKGTHGAGDDIVVELGLEPLQGI